MHQCARVNERQAEPEVRFMYVHGAEHGCEHHHQFVMVHAIGRELVKHTRTPTHARAPTCTQIVKKVTIGTVLEYMGTL